MIKIMWNGIKENGELAPAHYWFENGEKADWIHVSAREYAGFGPETSEWFTIKNSTGTMTDYFDKDRFEVNPGHPKYAEFLRAMITAEGVYRKQLQRRRAKLEARGFQDPMAVELKSSQARLERLETLLGAGRV